MRLSQPIRATQLKIHASSACPETWLWLNTICLVGSIPEAMKAAVTSRVLRVSSAGPPHTSTGHRDGVHVDDAIETVVRLLQLDEIDDRAEVIAEMQIAGRLDA